ncbi:MULTISPECIES: hypothetical protein [unclassified Nocardioides]|uniref:hypothetical protein n=1 Tax=unclassified Nocardioides TaxID=2615069 RepID=UPI0006FF8EEA|nr:MULTISPECIES: hypothetical protein [unclassified Nocardioides]KQY63543.1 hypothetical protein ASD30_00560 [Nocardioides sp. Root140]KQZ67444.1 hypothetical protein ASD66_21120 [Nocardioides sp. Root151]KRF17506.1 hypothetical protein ASH02_24880 [Nocardioides sp. Soil796]
MPDEVEIGSPLRRAFAHNDYARERPLFDALAHGFTAIEVDVFLEGGRLLVGHGTKDLLPDRTFESLYLEPLGALVEDRGHVWPDWPLTLLIDVKSEARSSYLAIHNALARRADLFTQHRNDGRLSGPVTVVVSGHTDPVLMASQQVRYATRDGRPGDLVDGLSAVTTTISAKFGKLFDWDGRGRIPSGEREGLRRVVSEIHRTGRSARFWGTNQHMWPELLSAGVDQIIADDLTALREFLLAHDGASRPA